MKDSLSGANALLAGSSLAWIKALLSLHMTLAHIALKPLTSLFPSDFLKVVPPPSLLSFSSQIWLSICLFPLKFSILHKILPAFLNSETFPKTLHYAAYPILFSVFRISLIIRCVDCISHHSCRKKGDMYMWPLLSANHGPGTSANICSYSGQREWKMLQVF